ncbi:DUF2147 domain-containing protein [Prolixibacter sp. SD074]|uniref:DUF2147 domain-containing protein n=1 Tax=Prolixibacter sp. SD074 TaxID=2652391 RepID=UPI00127DADFB|nr:DUF2147 domain-containing protein [Prolixibacter sp. SD074]GET29206.1 hypothetical protein SD074_14080 [Prolixibacter sp. SD074]
MKQFILSVFVLGFAFTTQANEPRDQLAGIWTNYLQNIRIEFYQTSNSYSAKIVWLSAPDDPQGHPKRDRNNPDPEKRGRPILGLNLITGLTGAGDEWNGGTIYAPKRGVYADCSVKVISDNELKLTVKRGLFTDTKIWTRVGP